MSESSDLIGLFGLTISPLEIVVRGTAVYWFLFLLFRFVMRRDVGAIAIADVLLLVMIADASQSAMAGEAKSIADGCLLVATIAGWNYLLDWSSYRFPWVRRFVESKPLPLIRDGRLLRANMRRELITKDELESKMREAGVSRLDAVRAAYLENDGEISLVLKEDRKGEGPGAGGSKKAADLPAILKPEVRDDEDESSEDGARPSIRTRPISH
jgi:uncharacterized membrane protein YcaP (DUF421 family)